MELSNYMEGVVTSYVDEVIAGEEDFCNCPRCRLELRQKGRGRRHYEHSRCDRVGCAEVCRSLLPFRMPHAAGLKKLVMGASPSSIEAALLKANHISVIISVTMGVT